MGPVKPAHGRKGQHTHTLISLYVSLDFYLDTFNKLIKKKNPPRNVSEKLVNFQKPDGQT